MRRAEAIHRGGHIEKDPLSGELKRLLEEPAGVGAISTMFGSSGDRFREGLLSAADEYARQGVTTAQNDWANPENRPISHLSPRIRWRMPTTSTTSRSSGR